MDNISHISSTVIKTELLRPSSAVFWTLDLNKKELVWSQELIEFFNIAADEIPSFKRMTDLILPSSVNVWENYIQSVITGKIPAPIEIAVRIKSQEKKLCVDSSKIHATNVVGFFQDITERSVIEDQLIRNEEKLNKFSQLATEGSIILDKAIITDVNPAFEKISGYTKDELQGKSAASLLTTDSVKTMAENLAKNYTFPYELILIHKSGKQIPVEVQGYYFEYREKTLRFTSVRDISKLKEKEKLGNNLSDLVELSKSKAVVSGAFMEAIANILEKICHTLNVSRSGIWQYNKNATYIRRIGLYERENKIFTSDRCITESINFNKCIDRLLNEGIVDVSVIDEDIATRDVNHGNFWPLNIKSLLQIPIIIDGEIRGIISLENLNETKQWSSNDILFVRSAVDILIITYKSFQRNRAEKKIKQKNVILNRQKALIEEKNKEVLDSIHYARRIQRAMMTSDIYLNKYLKDYFIFYQPKDIVSGDFYWAYETENKFYLIAADCTGHGVPGAFMSLINIASLNEVIVEKKITSPELILNEVRNNIIRALNPEGNEEGKDGMDCILCCFDFDSMTLDYAAANNSFYLIRDSELIVCGADKMPVGKGVDDKSFSLKKIDLKEGDAIYLLTDGYADQFGGSKGKKFKYKQLEQLLLSSNQEALKKQQDLLEKTFNKWKSNLEQVDDVLIIGIKL